MPPKIRFTRDNIIQTAFEIAKNEGAENINVRTVSKKLGCSTQPVMYHFKNIEELKDEVYQKADDYHTEYITNIDGNAQDMLKNIGARYIRFAVEEKHLFRFLFQSDNSQKNSIVDIIESGEEVPFSDLLQLLYGLNEAQSRDVFIQLFMYIHGLASVFANHYLPYDEEYITKKIELAIKSFVSASKTT